MHRILQNPGGDLEDQSFPACTADLICCLLNKKKLKPVAASAPCVGARPPGGNRPNVNQKAGAGLRAPSGPADRFHSGRFISPWPGASTIWAPLQTAAVCSRHAAQLLPAAGAEENRLSVRERPWAFVQTAAALKRRWGDEADWSLVIIIGNW